jgi:hypothetical protein
VRSKHRPAFGRGFTVGLVNVVKNRVRAFARNVLSAPLLVDTAYIVASLALAIGVLGILQAVGLQFGLDVSALGEDYVWVDLLQRGSGAGAANLWWALDDRNPLSPWWYIAAQDIILHFDAGLLALRYAMAALLALSAYCMVITVAGCRSRSFALALGVVIVFWMVNRYTEQIIWNFHVALCASLLSVATYAHFIKGDRRSYLLGGTSIVLYFVAIGTYTIQCGAVFAIGYLALRRTWATQADHRSRIVKGVIQAICDTAPYVALFTIFILIWRTTIDAGAVDAFSLQFNPGALLASVREGIWSTDLAPVFSRVYGSPDRDVIVAIAAGFGVLMLTGLQFRNRIGGGTPSIIGVPQLLDVFVVIGCIAAPTIALESSSQTWTPGARWPMIYQLTTPAFFLSCAAAILLLTTRTGLLRQWLWTATVGLAVVIGELLSLGHNQLQVEISRNEKFIRESIIRLVAEDFALGRRPPEQVLLMLHGVSKSRWRSSDILSPTIARVWLQRKDISFRLVNWLPTPNSYWASWWPIRFGFDSDGVGNVKVPYNAQLPKLLDGAVPYDQVRILDVRGHTAQRVLVANKSDFSGREVEWDRDGPITFPGVDPAKLCPLTWSADQDVLSSGWSVPERDEKGAFRWTTSTSARLTFPAACPDHSTLRVVVAFAIASENLDDLVLKANGQRLRYRRQTTDGSLVYEAELPPGVLSTGPTVDLELAVRMLSTAPGDNRRLGVAVRAIEILPPAPGRG